MDSLYNKAINLGATDFGYKKDKFFVVYDGVTINFCLKGYNNFSKNKQMSYWSRYTKIKDRMGRRLINDKRSHIYWKAQLLLK
jgi:hypothetical protein